MKVTKGFDGLQDAKLLAMCFFVALIFLSGSGMGATGTITVLKNSVTSGTFSGGSETGIHTTPNLHNLTFNILNYNLPNSIDLYPVQSTPTYVNAHVSYATSGESTSFTITSGGSGNGWFSYDATTKDLNWVFAVGSVATSSNMVLSYSNEQVINNISFSYDGGTTWSACGQPNHNAGFLRHTADSNFPILIDGLVGLQGYSNSACVGQYYFSYALGYGVKTSVTYNVTHPNLINPLYTNILINKSGSFQNTKMFVNNAVNQVYTYESTFNNGTYNPSITENYGLRLNVTTVSGGYNNVYIENPFVAGVNGVMLVPNWTNQQNISGIQSVNTSDITLYYSANSSQHWYGSPQLFVTYRYYNASTGVYDPIEYPLYNLNLLPGDSGLVSLKDTILGNVRGATGGYINLSGKTFFLKSRLVDPILWQTYGTNYGYDDVAVNLGNETPPPEPTPTPTPIILPTGSATETATALPTPGQVTGNFSGNNATNNASGWSTTINNISGYITGISSGIGNITTTTNNLSGQLNSVNQTQSRTILLPAFTYALPAIPTDIKLLFLYVMILVGVLLILDR